MDELKREERKKLHKRKRKEAQKKRRACPGYIIGPSRGVGHVTGVGRLLPGRCRCQSPDDNLTTRDIAFMPYSAGTNN
jgi:hypothetical protein